MSVRTKRRCSFCDKDVSVTTTTVLYRHKGIGGHPCPGSSQVPLSVTYWRTSDDFVNATCMICGTFRYARLDDFDGKTFFAEHSHPEQRTETTP